MNSYSIAQDSPRGSRLVLDSIFHPTDFSPESEEALAHAFKLALAVGAELRILHVDPPGTATPVANYPNIQDMWSRWEREKRPQPVGTQTSYPIPRIRKIRTSGNITRSIVEHLEHHPANLMVLATHQHGGLPRWLKREVAERVALATKMMSLFIPPFSRGFVDRTTGQVLLKRILIPVTQDPYPQPAVDSACWLNHALGCLEGNFTLLHIGTHHDMPFVNQPLRTGWVWDTQYRDGEVVEQILRWEQENTPRLICMMTRGHDDLLDEIRGNHTEHVIQKVRCPVLAIPTS